MIPVLFIRYSHIYTTSLRRLAEKKIIVELNRDTFEEKHHELLKNQKILEEHLDLISKTVKTNWKRIEIPIYIIPFRAKGTTFSDPLTISLCTSKANPMKIEKIIYLIDHEIIHNALNELPAIKNILKEIKKDYPNLHPESYAHILVYSTQLLVYQNLGLEDLCKNKIEYRKENPTVYEGWKVVNKEGAKKNNRKVFIQTKRCRYVPLRSNNKSQKPRRVISIILRGKGRKTFKLKNPLRSTKVSSEILEKLHSTDATDRWEGVLELVAKYPKKSKYILQKMLNDPDREVRRLVTLKLASLGDYNVPELYGSSLTNPEFMDEKRSIVRVHQDKPERNTILLGGKLRGKVVIKIMRKHNLDAWKLAIEKGIPVEPIQRDKFGNFRITLRRNGNFLVVPSVLHGMTVRAFLSDEKRRKKFEQTITEQMHSIERSLKKGKIVHGHIHDQNFIVVWVRKKNKKFPKVYLVDFDKAYVSK